MGEQFDPDEIRAAAEVMLGFHRRCEEILTLLGEKRWLSTHKRLEVERLYRSLKHDLKEAAGTGTLSRRRRTMTRVESCFFDPSVRRAAIALRPATNSNPISSRWFAAVYEAQLELSYWLHNMGCPPAAQA